MTAEEKMAYAESDEGRRAAQERLSRLMRMDAMIALRLSQIDALREKSRAIHAVLAGIIGGGTGDRTGETAAQLADMEEDLRRDYHALMEERQTLRDIIRLIPDETQRTVLEMRYLESMPFFRIAMAMNYDERTVYRLHRKALSRAALYLMETGIVAPRSAG